MMDFKSIFKILKNTVSKHRIPICVGAGLAAGAVGVIFTATGTIKATRLVDAKKIETNSEELSIKDTVKTCWVCYIPAAACFALCLLGVISGVHFGMKETATLAASLVATEQAFSEYQKQAIKVVGNETESEIRQKVVEEKMSKPNPTKENPVRTTYGGDVKCYDPFNDRYFMTNINTLERGINNLNRLILSNTSASLSDFCFEIGLNPTRLGDEFGWNRQDGIVELSRSYCGDEEEAPCMCLEFNVRPHLGYDDYMI